MTWIFRRAANGPAIRAAMNRIQAHLLEFWLFVDEPRAIWKSWKGLLAANARLLGRLLVPLPDPLHPCRCRSSFFWTPVMELRPCLWANRRW